MLFLLQLYQEIQKACVSKGGIFMMNEEEFIESQKECASMLGMSLTEYQEYCANVKVPTDEEEKDDDNEEDIALELLKDLGLSEKNLKRRGD